MTSYINRQILAALIIATLILGGTSTLAMAAGGGAVPESGVPYCEVEPEGYEVCRIWDVTGVNITLTHIYTWDQNPDSSHRQFQVAYVNIDDAHLVDSLSAINIPGDPLLVPSINTGGSLTAQAIYEMTESNFAVIGGTSAITESEMETMFFARMNSFEHGGGPLYMERFYGNSRTETMLDSFYAGQGYRNAANMPCCPSSGK